MVYALNSLLGRLTGCRLYSVQFVMDYVQLWFDSETSSDTPLLTCEALPHVILVGRRLTPAEADWAQALLTLIGQSVIATHEKNGIGLKLDFDRGTIHLHPTGDELEGPEIATLSGFNDRSWMTWRPGEEAFEDL